MIRERYTSIEFEKKWCDEIFDSLSSVQRNILVLYDKMGIASSSASMADLFTKGSHNKKLTVIYMVQTCIIRVNTKKQYHWTNTKVWFFVTVGTPRSSALLRTNYVQMTVSNLLIHIRMPPPNLIRSWSQTTTHQHLKIRRSCLIFYLEISLQTI